MYWRLKPGGKVFIVSGTPYRGNIGALIPIYEECKRKGVPWPGEFENIQAYSDHYTIKELPAFLHLLDDEVPVDAFTNLFMKDSLPYTFDGGHHSKYMDKPIQYLFEMQP